MLESILQVIKQAKNDFIFIRKVASPYVHFASQICTAQGNLTLLYTEKSSIFPIQ